MSATTGNRARHPTSHENVTTSDPLRQIFLGKFCSRPLPLSFRFHYIRIRFSCGTRKGRDELFGNRCFAQQ